MREFPDRPGVSDAARQRAFGHRPSRYLFGECPVCGQRFRKREAHRRYCSRDCSAMAHPPPIKKGPSATNWKGGMPIWVCAACGATFSGYRKVESQPRKFCSWHCANHANPGRAEFDMRSRYAFEYEALERLERAGYKGIRSAGSRGPFDLFGISPAGCRMVQVKSTKRPGHPGTVKMLVDAIEELRTITAPSNTRKWLYTKILRGPWLEWDVTDWPMLRSELRDRVRQELAEVL